MKTHITSQQVTLRTGQHKNLSNTKVKLISASRGWEIAGAGERWTDGYFAVHFIVDNARHGSRYTRENWEKAHQHFDRITK